MSTYDEFDEKEYGKLTGNIFSRIISLLKPHWKNAIGFLLCIALVSGIDAYTTYLSAQLVDQGIIAGSRQAIIRTVMIYGSVVLVQAFAAFGFIYLVGLLAERVRYDLRKQMFNHLQQRRAGRRRVASGRSREDRDVVQVLARSVNNSDLAAGAKPGVDANRNSRPCRRRH